MRERERDVHIYRALVLRQRIQEEAKESLAFGSHKLVERAFLQVEPHSFQLLIFTSWFARTNHHDHASGPFTR